jgi:hypothetical protein
VPGCCAPDGTPKTAVIRVKGGVWSATTPTRATTPGPPLDFANSDTPFSPDESRELAAALANDDHARAVALLERHATLDYPENKGFDKQRPIRIPLRPHRLRPHRLDLTSPSLRRGDRAPAVGQRHLGKRGSAASTTSTIIPGVLTGTQEIGCFLFHRGHADDITDR